MPPQPGNGITAAHSRAPIRLAMWADTRANASLRPADGSTEFRPARGVFLKVVSGDLDLSAAPARVGYRTSPADAIA